MSGIYFKNTKTVLPDSVINSGVTVENGKITAIGDTGRADRVIDANGGWLFPGFVDVHVHGGGGADFMDGTPSAFETAVKAHLKKGTTTIVPTAMTASKEEMLGFINAFHGFKKQSELADVARGLHLEGPYLSSAGKSSKGAQSAEYLRSIDLLETEDILTAAKGSILRWDAAPELENSDRFASVMRQNGIICSVAHSNATAAQAKHSFDNGFSHITHFYNAVTAYMKREQRVTAGIVEAAYLSDTVTVELICDGRHIPKECLLLALKVMGTERVMGITDATRLACTDLSSGKLGSLKSGTDVIVDDGVAKLPDMSSYAGSICTMERALKVLCVDFGLEPFVAARLLSLNPARHIGAENIGAIAIGYNADLVITDNDFNVTAVLKNGIEI